MKVALVLSGGGMFGAWQAGAWSALEHRLRPDLVVGCSVGGLNGYSIACGADGERLRSMWLTPELTGVRGLRANIQRLTAEFKPKIPFGVTATDALRCRPVLFRNDQIDWRHLMASCTVPLVYLPVKIDGRLYVDGGLLNNLPVWAAIEMGATHVVALNALPQTPGWWLRPLVKWFRMAANYVPPPLGDVQVDILTPGKLLGGPYDAMHWNEETSRRWFEKGEEDAQKNISILNCPER
jgi:NTE family protein